MWFIRRMEKYLFFKHAEALELIVRFDYRVWAPDFSNESVCPNLWLSDRPARRWHSTVYLSIWWGRWRLFLWEWMNVSCLTGVSCCLRLLTALEFMARNEMRFIPSVHIRSFFTFMTEEVGAWMGASALMALILTINPPATWILNQCYWIRSNCESWTNMQFSKTLHYLLLHSDPLDQRRQIIFLLFFSNVNMDHLFYSKLHTQSF